jgi:phospholipid/cholesterol/gamma-HCH transport system substrate-binding protein
MSTRRLVARRAPVTLALAIGAVVLLFVSKGPARYDIVAEFSDVQGLVPGAQVELAGVTVGEVQSIRLGSDGYPRVQVAIDAGVRMRATGTATVRLASLSGEFNDYVSIVQGAGAPLRPGAVLERRRTTSPVSFDQAIGTFDAPTRAALSAMLSGLTRSLSGQGPALAATLRTSARALEQTASLADAVGSDGGSLRSLLASTNTIVAALDTRRADLAGAVDGVHGVLQTLAARAGAISTGVAALPSGLDAAKQTLTRGQGLIAPARALLATARPTIAQLPAVSNELRAALLVARPALRRAASVATRAPGALTALMPLLGAAKPLLAVLAPVLQRAGPMLDQLRVRLPDAFSFFANWADFTANYDANGHAARVGIVLTPAPVNVLSPDSNGAGQLAPPYLRTPGSLEGQPWTDYFKSFVDGGKAAPDVGRGR